jgi:hypothetical protein
VTEQNQGGAGPAAAQPDAAGAAPGGSPSVAAALAELDSVADRALAEHPAVFERVHEQLNAALSAIDDA